MKTTFNIRYLARLGVVATIVGGFFFAFHGGSPKGPTNGGAARAPQELVAILQYLQSDYPAAVASKNMTELAEQRSLSADAVLIAEQWAPGPAFGARVASIDARIRLGSDPAGVSTDCASLADDVVAASGIARSPRAPPDLVEGARLFAQTCAGCHGLTGHGDGAAASGLDPKPANFHSNDVMAGLTPFKVFNVVRFGVKGTAMAPFEDLDEKRRWALAFYVFSLRQPACDHTPMRASIDELANRSDSELATSFGAGEVACLRRKVLEPDARSLVGAARSQVEMAMGLASRGDGKGAEKALLDAYLSDIEPIEPWLRARDPEAVTQLEVLFTATRVALKRGDPRARDDEVQLMALLDRAAGAHRVTTKISVFWFAVLVIVREGFEAAVVVAALLAVLKKRKQVSRARFVHAGWTSAIGIGAVAFVLGRRALAAAMSERLEGFLAFVAVAMLLHAALWLNARTTTRKTMGDLRERTRGALDRGALALFGIAFVAVFRESFETAVFLEALSIEAPSAVVWGASAGAVALTTLVVAVGRLGLRLPMQALFKSSTVVLLATAVVLLGQGIHSFEEVGLLPPYPMRFFRIDFLGIYPDRLGVFAQLALSSVPILWKVLSRPSAPSISGFDPAE